MVLSGCRFPTLRLRASTVGYLPDFDVVDWFKRWGGRCRRNLRKDCSTDGTGALRKLVRIRILGLDPMSQTGDGRIFGAVVASITSAMAMTTDNNAVHRSTAWRVSPMDNLDTVPGDGPRYLRELCRTQAHAMTSLAQNASDDSMTKAARRKWPRWLALPSFAFCGVTTLLVCVAYFVWIIIDAQYSTTAFVARYTVGLQHLEPAPSAVAYGLWDMMWDGVRSWDSLGPRLLLFALLGVTGAASFSLMLIQFRRRATIRRMLLTVLVICVWLSLWSSYDRLNEWAVLRRVRSALPRFEIVAKSLSQDWPTENGTLPEAGAFYVYPTRRPSLLFLSAGDGYPIREDFNYLVERSEKGALRFDLTGATDCKLEFHPDGSTPTSYATRLSGARMRVGEATRLKEHWYLVRYGES